MTILSNKFGGAALAGLMGAGMLASGSAQAGGEHMECGYQNTYDRYGYEYHACNGKNDWRAVRDMNCPHKYADHAACNGYHDCKGHHDKKHGHHDKKHR